MTDLGEPTSTEEAKASALLRRGSLAAIGGSLLALGAPSALVLLASSRQAGLSAASRNVLETESLLVVAGAVLLLLALVLYRLAFVRLKHVDRRLRSVSHLCLVGSAGAIALIAAGAVVAEGSSAITGCLAGHAAHALSCLRSEDPSFGYLSVVGFWLLWLGAAGVAAGLVLAGRHFGRRSLTAGGVVYAVLVAAVVAPFATLLAPIPASGYALGGAPVAAVVAAALVFVGARSTLARGA